LIENILVAVKEMTYFALLYNTYGKTSKQIGVLSSTFSQFLGVDFNQILGANYRLGSKYLRFSQFHYNIYSDLFSIGHGMPE
jgi:hypothetical protein